MRYAIGPPARLIKSPLSIWPGEAHGVGNGVGDGCGVAVGLGSIVGVIAGVGSSVAVAVIAAGASASTARVGTVGGAAQAGRKKNQAMQMKNVCLIMILSI